MTFYTKYSSAKAEVQELIDDIKSEAYNQVSGGNMLLVCPEDKLEEFAVQALEVLPEAQEDIFEMIDPTILCQLIIKLNKAYSRDEREDVFFSFQSDLNNSIANYFRENINSIYEDAAILCMKCRGMDEYGCGPEIGYIYN